jgi:hypothetical protein
MFRRSCSGPFNGLFDHIFTEFPSPITKEEMDREIRAFRDEMLPQQIKQAKIDSAEFNKRWKDASPENMRKQQQEWLLNKLAEADECIRLNKPLGP